MKKIFAVVIVTPVLTLFIGIGVLAYKISGTWDNRNTDVLIANITAICGISGIVIALVVSAFIGLVFYSRWQQDRLWSPKLPKQVPLQPQVPAWDAPPPLQLNDKKGHLYSAGPAGYEDLSGDVFGETATIDNIDWSH